MSSKKLYFDDRDLFIVTATLKASAGGRTRSLVQRASLLAAATQTQVNICSIGYNPNIEEDLNAFYESGRMHPLVKVHNIYLDMSSEERRQDEIEHFFHDKGYDVIQENGYRYIHFKKGVKHYLKDFDENKNRLHHVNHYCGSSRKVVSRDHYDFKGYLHRRDILGNDNSISQEIYFDRSGKAYLTKTYKLDGRDKELEKVYHFGNRLDKETYESMNDLYTHWLSSKISRKSIFVCDARIMDESVLNIKSPLARKLFQLHNNYHVDPMNLASPLKGRAKALATRADEADKVVALTHDQMQDFVQSTGLSESAGTYVSHSIEKEYLVVERSQTRIVMVARLADQKRISHAVLAFKKFVSDFPNYTLHIYGEGVEEDALHHLIAAEGLSSICFLEGYTSNAKEVFQSAAFSLVSSKFEGFPLSVMESLANGCPVVSYDINFGPRDLIVQGVNGYLARAGDVEDLAAKMVALVQSDVLGRDEKIQASIERLSHVAFSQKWCDLINSV